MNESGKWTAQDALVQFLGAADDLIASVGEIPDDVDGLNLRTEKNQVKASVENVRNHVKKLQKLSAT